MRHRPPAFLLLLIFHLALFAPTVVAEDTALTDVDVVRLVMQSNSEAKIIQIIQSSEVDFDLSDEMVDELRLAGVTPKILKAMIERQAELAATADSESAGAGDEAAPSPSFRLNLNREAAAAADDPPTLVMINLIDARLIEALQLRTPEPMITDLAVVLLCRTADHVPDHWRSQTPLGRDFVTTPRHRMLHFHSGAETTPVSKARERLSKLAKVPGEWSSMPKLAILELPVPAELGAELERGIEHDLSVGIAAEIGGRFFLLASDDRDAVVIGPEGTTEFDAILLSEGKGARKLRAQFTKPN